MSGAYGGSAYGGAAYSPVVAQSSFAGTMPYSVVTEIAFASNPLDDPATWTDVSLYVRSITTNRGRQHELNRFEAGTATVVLDNKDGRFSPFNTSSPYNPNVLPYKQIRVRALYNGVMYPIFRGHIQAWPVQWPAPNDSTVTVNAVDGFKMLNLKKAQQFSPTYQSVVVADAPTVLYMLNDAPGSTVCLDSSGNANHGAVFGLSGVSPPSSLGGPSILKADASTSFDCGNALGNANTFVWGEAICPSNVLLASTNDWSVELWVQPRQTAVADGLIQAAGGSASLAVTTTSDNRITATLTDGVTPLTVTSTSKAPVGSPTMVTVTYAHTAKNLKIAINGVQEITGTFGGGAFSLGGALLNAAVAFGKIDGVIQACAVWTTVDVIAAANVFIAYHYFAGATPLFASKAFGSITGYQTTGTRIQALLTAVGWPATLTKVDAGLITCQTGTNDLVNNTVLANCQVTSDTELGELFIGADGSVVFYDHLHKYKTPNGIAALTLGDSGTTGPGGESPYLLDSVAIAFDDLDIYNNAQVTPSGQGAQTANDTTSQTAYGIRTTSKSGVHQLTSDAINEAGFLVGQYKTPLQRISSISFTPMSDPTVLLPAALGFDLLTRVTVKRRPKDGAGSTFSQDSLIEGIEHRIVPGMWSTSYRLSPTDASPVPWIIDDPVAGKVVDGGSQSPKVVIGF